jgi:N-acetylmuramoyl-L-alanine amidase
MAHAIFVAFQRYKSDLEGGDGKIVEAPSFKKEKRFAAEQINNNEKIEEQTSFQNSLEEKDESDKITLRVQIVTSRTKLPVYDDRFKGLKVFEYFESDLYKYTSGEFVNDLDAARKHKAMLKEKGFEHAFIVAFKNEERISALDAVKQLTE